MGSDLEVLTIIPAVSHSAANHHSATEGQGLFSATEPHTTQKKEMLFSDSWLCHQILSIVNMIRIRDDGQPWLSPTLTDDVFDFLLRKQTQLLLWLNKDHMAHSSSLGTPYSCSTAVTETEVNLGTQS